MRIGEFAREAGVTAKTVRFYEQTGLLPQPPRTAAGYRDYAPGDVERLRFVRSAQAAGLSLAEIGEVLRLSDSGQRPCAHVRDILTAHLEQVEERLVELRDARARLLRLAEIAEATDPGDCPPESVCRILRNHAS
ncbi:heavy metal-responsive transcriptional regulator [Lipingzhangella sp. LS1_29]|uniref:Heavy metal-responsive transcriptional regulator n=1 Tax=Lipingzhangella rawalii TaxID=2055835 RepID=A0ABU2H4L6_9ACTN|nr:heavy metal-responsive transcriptional regulator [Lipingzhangella rawalii]MDS1270254.1 heavy metal-responsive transcriptional regulator [Lipingzhangella rawalii]